MPTILVALLRESPGERAENARGAQAPVPLQGKEASDRGQENVKQEGHWIYLT